MYNSIEFQAIIFDCNSMRSCCLIFMESRLKISFAFAFVFEKSSMAGFSQRNS